jgi:AcrR family transcriptional regulator
LSGSLIGMSGGEQGAGRLRADAARNRQAIIATAREVYGQRGLDAPLDDIARAAGVGNATVYRHFPTRCALVAASFADALRRIIDHADQALHDPDPWSGFRAHVTFLCRLQATDRGLADLLTTQVTAAPELEGLRGEAYRAFVRLAQRARTAGALRADFVAEDLVLLLMANAGLVHRTAEAAPAAWERFIDLALDGLRSQAATPAASPAGADAVQRAMRRHGEQLGYG